MTRDRPFGTDRPPMRSDRALHSIALWGLIAVSVFQAASAIAGGVALLVTGGLGMPASMLASAPFRSFVVPALIIALALTGVVAWLPREPLRHRERARRGRARVGS